MTLGPGQGLPYGHGLMRSSSADRERAIDVLKAAFAEGRLTRDEFEERSGQVLRSQTYGELAALTADLPVGPLGTQLPPQLPYRVAPAYPYPVVAPRRPVNSLATIALVCSLIPGFPAAAGIITGIVAHRQIRRTGERGAGMATAAILIGAFTLVAFLLYLAGLVGSG
jgi:Domain of unknown function (DUF1707)/Domain of unknown function (DUF4190)